MEFRSLPSAEADAIKAHRDDAVVVCYPKARIHWGVAINVDKKPFDDERVQKALAIDRDEMVKVIARWPA